jgi:hypothetical protein
VLPPGFGLRQPSGAFAEQVTDREWVELRCDRRMSRQRLLLPRRKAVEGYRSPRRSRDPRGRLELPPGFGLRQSSGAFAGRVTDRAWVESRCDRRMSRQRLLLPRRKAVEGYRSPRRSRGGRKSVSHGPYH